MQLGNFSVSLAVKDIAVSRAFYEKLGFTQIAGDQAQNWSILQNSTSTIGLFQGPQFTRNMLTGGTEPAAPCRTSTMCATFSGRSRIEASCRPRRPMSLPRAPQAWC